MKFTLHIFIKFSIYQTRRIINNFPLDSRNTLEIPFKQKYLLNSENILIVSLNYICGYVKIISSDFITTGWGQYYGKFFGIPF